MTSLLVAARDLRLFIGRSPGSLDGQDFIQKLDQLKAAHVSDHRKNASQISKATRELDEIREKAAALLTTHSKGLPLSSALHILNILQIRGLIPSPTATLSEEQADLASTFDMRASRQSQILSPTELTTLSNHDPSRVVTFPRTNNKGFFIVGSTGIDDYDREFRTPTVSRYILGNWNEERHRYLPIASGGSSEVYIAREDGTPRSVAIKMAAIRHRDDRKIILQRFRNGQYFQSLLGRDRFVHYYETGTMHDGTPFIVMELMKESLSDYMKAREKNHTPLSIEKAHSLGLKIIAPVAMMHKHIAETSEGPIEGIIHRDIKLENYLFSSDGKVKLSDFDLAGNVKQIGPTSPEQTQGTPGHWVYDEPDTLARDVFALGTVLFMLFTQKKPFSGNSPIEVVFSVFKQRREDLRQELDKQHVPRPLSDIILRAMSISREERYQDAAELFLEFGAVKARFLEAKAERFLQDNALSRDVRNAWRIMIEEALAEYESAYQQYPHPEINETMIRLHRELHDYAAAVHDHEALRYALKRINRLTERGHLRVNAAS